MNPMITKARRFYWLLGATAILIVACNSDDSTRFASAERPPNLDAKIEVVLGDNDPSSKSYHYSQTMSNATNFKYKVEIEKKYKVSDPSGAARAFAIVDGDTLFTSCEDWLTSPGSNHSVFIFASASHSISRGNPASASVKL